MYEGCFLRSLFHFHFVLLVYKPWGERAGGWRGRERERENNPILYGKMVNTDSLKLCKFIAFSFFNVLQ